MNTLTIVSSLALIFIAPIAAGLVVRFLAGFGDDDGLATLMAPFRSPYLRDSDPVVPEGEPVAFRFAAPDPA